ncbi:MAG: class I SAM-dependent methyltransferase [Bryobacteraceae bacterium]
MPFDRQQLHAELSQLYSRPFLSPENLPQYDEESCRSHAERNIRYFLDPFVLDYNFQCLEIGCGRGALSGLLAQRGVQALAIDKIEFPEQWGKWRSASNNVRFHRADFHRIELGNSSFDVIVSIGTWEHL